ncbi:D-galacturonate reductase [Helianthus annuus]|uniref:D-galacturonate reductase n=1 Tax=Helianthus annuus TaxID=4232 RepID=UPI000B8EFD82|nr:D-galacturonate reductase [Helianthus annuus]
MVTIPELMISSSEGARPCPVIAMGTSSESGIAGKEAVSPSTLVEAIKMGYRHFDTAALYRSEKPVGDAIAEALRLGLIKSRSEIFVTTKLWCNSADRHLVLPAIKQSLKKLGLEYVDLYLIHWPFKLIQDDMKLPIPNECIASIDIKAVWESMEECQNLGLTKSIGVSNFSSKRIKEILSFAKIPPAVNQVEMNALWQQKKLNEFCKENGIVVTAYSPLGAAGNSAWGDNHVMECDVLQDIAKSKGKTVAQISLRWLYEQGVIIAVKSFNPERMRLNLDIFDWCLTEEELGKIAQIPQRKLVYLIGSLMTTEHNDLLAEIDADID